MNNDNNETFIRTDTYMIGDILNFNPSHFISSLRRFHTFHIVPAVFKHFNTSWRRRLFVPLVNTGKTLGTRHVGGSAPSFQHRHVLLQPRRSLHGLRLDLFLLDGDRFTFARRPVPLGPFQTRIFGNVRVRNGQFFLLIAVLRVYR